MEGRASISLCSRKRRSVQAILRQCRPTTLIVVEETDESICAILYYDFAVQVLAFIGIIGMVSGCVLKPKVIESLKMIEELCCAYGNKFAFRVMIRDFEEVRYGFRQPNFPMTLDFVVDLCNHFFAGDGICRRRRHLCGMDRSSDGEFGIEGLLRLGDVFEYIVHDGHAVVLSV